MTASGTGRLEAFSDGVFAIAITLLILEILVPIASELHDGLWAALAQRWPDYVGYVLSFLVIGVMWANHHALFGYIRRVNRTLILANLLLLMGVAFLPFPTAILAEHLADPLTRTAATVFYGASLVFTPFRSTCSGGLGAGRRACLGPRCPYKVFIPLPVGTP